jgi:hypothetical protein
VVVPKLWRSPKQQAASLRYAEKGAPPNGVATILNRAGESIEALNSIEARCMLREQIRGTQPAAMTGDRDTHEAAGKGSVMPPDTKKALAMIDAFTGTGATAFDVSLLDIDEQDKGYQSNRSADELRRHLSARLEAASRAQLNVIIRPRSANVLFIQLDDLDHATGQARIWPHAFMSVETSPGNYQFWLAVSDGPKDSDKEAAKQFRKRVRAGAHADKSASGAVRLAGSLNIKHKYAPDFPVVTVSQVEAGRTVSVATLDAAGLIAPPDAVTPPRSVPPFKRPPPRADAPRHWPDYRRALQGAPIKKDGGGPDRSLADFMWSKWAAQRGWNADEIAAKLIDVSDKAKERAGKGDTGYATLTAQNAVAVMDRERGGRSPANPTPRPA